MANKRIKDLTALGTSPASDDEFAVSDTSTNVDKRVTRAELEAPVQQTVTARAMLFFLMEM